MSARSDDAEIFNHQATIQDVVEAQRKALQKALEETPADQLDRPTEEAIAECVERFRLDVPSLGRSAIVQLPTEELDVDVSQDRMRAIFDRTRPFYVKGTRVRIRVPFTGEAKLFEFRSSFFEASVEAHVEGCSLILSYVGINPSKEDVARELESRLNRIEERLRRMRGFAEQWNNEIPRVARPLLDVRREKLRRDKDLQLPYPMAPVSDALVTAPGRMVAPHAAPRSPAAEFQQERFDVFISHASEDKDSIARPLYRELVARGVKVWFDEAVLTLGDSLRRKIDEGLVRCRYGVVILSPHFFRKQWPQKELDGLVARETESGQKAILPVWHQIDQAGVIAYSPMLADRVAARSSEGIPAIVTRILHVLKG